MGTPFLRALDLAVQGQLSKIKKQATRLQKSSERIFGSTYSANVCEEAIAAANGFRNWSEVENLEKELVPEKDKPFWEISYRNETHQRILEAIRSIEAGVSSDRPTIVLGDLKNSMPAAVCLWAERISQRKEPGIIAIDTKLPTFQKTNAYQAAKRLGLAQTFEQFRIIDAREPAIPLCITAPVKDWMFAIKKATPAADWELLQDARITANLQRLALLHANNVGREDYQCIDPTFLVTAIDLLQPQKHDIIKGLIPLSKNKTAWWYTPLVSHFVECTTSSEHPAYTSDAFARLTNLINALGKQIAAHGVVLRTLAKSRPVVVLYDSDIPNSIASADIIRMMFTPGEDSPHDETKTELHCITDESKRMPALASTGEVILANGESDIHCANWSTQVRSSPTFIHATDDGLISSGKWASTGNHVETPELWSLRALSLFKSVTQAVFHSNSMMMLEKSFHEVFKLESVEALYLEGRKESLLNNGKWSDGYALVKTYLEEELPQYKTSILLGDGYQVQDKGALEFHQTLVSILEKITSDWTKQHD